MVEKATDADFECGSSSRQLGDRVRVEFQTMNGDSAWESRATFDGTVVESSAADDLTTPILADKPIPASNGHKFSSLLGIHEQPFLITSEAGDSEIQARFRIFPEILKHTD
jgi:hypothetical protein